VGIVSDNWQLNTGNFMQTILITGAARRIGREIALGLAADGWDIALHYHHSQGEAESAAQAIRALGRRVVLLAADLNDADAVQRLVPRAVEGLGGLSCLIHNASLFEKDSPATLTPESWHRHMDLHALAPALLAREFAAQYEGEAGNIIHLTDACLNWSLSPEFLSYTVSKAALWNLTQLLAKGLAPCIRVNAIAPGPTLPSHHDTESGAYDRLVASTPMQRASSPEEVVQAVRFVLSTPSLTGQMIALNSGMHLLPGVR
jgi:NAD(P)-dependent dehydrogenase (short-subunit alcohol dehydrogenase family)